jgi:glycosyltransferase involved in cell wall biosynthesis
MHGSPTDRQAPLVTVVTPTLNRAEFLESTVRSVRAQSYGHVEHLVVDGGSTDRTLSVLRSYEGAYELRWISEPDRGMYAAINKGLALARGEILAYLNSDDLYFPWTLEVVVDAFNRNPDVDVIFGEVMDIDDASGRQIIAWALPFRLDYLRRAGFMWQPAVFWRRRVFVQEGAFDESLRYGADLDYWLRLGARNHRFLKKHEFLAVARQHPDTLSLVHRSRVLEELGEIRRRHSLAPARARPWHRPLDALRRPLWTRVYWIGLIVQSLVPTRIRRGPWSRLLGAGHTSISYAAVLLRPIPGLGRRVAGPLLRPNRYWLQPN